MNKASKLYPIVFSLFFFCILLLQLIGTRLRLDAVSEKFWLRLELIRAFNAFRYAAGDSVFNEGLAGMDGWLFYSGDFSIHDYQKTEPLGRKRLKQLAEALSSLDRAAAIYGGRLWLVIPPDKNTIYPQYMPVEIPVIGKTSRLDQLMTYLQKETEIEALDLRPAFLSVSQSAQIYYKADAHWNCLGAYYASNEILAPVSALHPEAQAHPLTDYEFGTMTDSTLDIAGVMGLGLQEESVTLTPKFTAGAISRQPYGQGSSMLVAVNAQPDLPTALVIHDSFYTECLYQFLEPQFSRVIFSHYEKASLSDYLALIATEQPDVVLVEFAERHIEYFFKNMTPESQ